MLAGPEELGERVGEDGDHGMQRAARRRQPQGRRRDMQGRPAPVVDGIRIGAGGEQHPDDRGRVVAGNGIMQQREPALAAPVGIAAAGVEKGPDHGRVPVVQDGDSQWRKPPAISCIEVRATSEKGSDRFGVGLP